MLPDSGGWDEPVHTADHSQASGPWTHLKFTNVSSILCCIMQEPLASGGHFKFKFIKMNET